MSRAIGAHVPRGDRQHKAAPPSGPFEVHGYWTPGPPWTHALTLTQPGSVHYEPHHCGTCGMCICGCEDCHDRLIKVCVCMDCPCGFGETGSDAEVAGFEAAHWEHAEVTG